MNGLEFFQDKCWCSPSISKTWPATMPRLPEARDKLAIRSTPWSDLANPPALLRHRDLGTRHHLPILPSLRQISCDLSSPPTVIVIIHGRKIIVNQAPCMNHFKAAATLRMSWSNSDLQGFQNSRRERSNTLATSMNGIENGLSQTRGKLLVSIKNFPKQTRQELIFSCFFIQNHFLFRLLAWL